MSEDKAHQRLVTGQAWEDYCEAVRRAGRMIDQFGDEVDDLDRAEWYRFMTRLMRNGFERFVENCEPERPRIRLTPWRQAINFQSPDQDHLLAEFIDGSAEYRITGNRGTIPYFVMASWTAMQPKDLGARNWAEAGVASLKEFDPAMLRTTAFLPSDDITFDENGNFEVILSQTKPADGKNWLPITADCVGILVRTLHHERHKEVPPVMQIERIDGAKPRPVTPVDMATNLAKAAQIVLGYAELVRSWWQDNLGKRPNRIRFSRAVYLSNGGVPDRHHGFGTWQRADYEALVLQFTPTPCQYWIFQLCNMWQENLDCYEDGQGYVTKYTARYEDDGSVRIIIANEDPGIGGNWVDPFSHTHGGMSLRLIKTAGDPPPVTLHRVKLADLKQNGLAALNSADAIVSGEITD